MRPVTAAAHSADIQRDVALLLEPGQVAADLRHLEPQGAIRRAITRSLHGPGVDTALVVTGVSRRGLVDVSDLGLIAVEVAGAPSKYATPRQRGLVTDILD